MANLEQHQTKQQAGYRWTVPKPKYSHDLPPLKIFNSFSRKKELFVPIERKTIRWYCCGPTVYDVAHLGHARCYITFDIIRRILSAYFGYQVYYVMNITDIDDKIIKRARSNYLCDKYVAQLVAQFKEEAATESLSYIEKAITNYKARRVNEQDPAKILMIDNIMSKSNATFEKLSILVKQEKNKNIVDSELQIALDSLRDVIADEQDVNFGHTVTDHNIFKSLTKSFEDEYHKDMQRLDVLPPSVLSRVSEYIDDIGSYIKKLETNGYAYRSGGSVYFDTEKFDAQPKHFYAKLVREAYGHKKGLDEGEGELCQQDKKKSSSDFVLWKRSKSGEPQWQTQDFEPGRPGWHIECSVMASKLLGESFDIHSGGYDLKFPHHDNEIAQAEAYYDTGNNWVNYFIHSGHLTISGCKMSKSLKNFITIRQALEDYTSRQLRFAFLVHGWAETLDYSANTMNTAICYEKTFREFFLTMSDVFRRRHDSGDLNGQFMKWTDDDMVLNENFLISVNKVDEALCDNFDTKSALNALCNLVKTCNKQVSMNISLAKDITTYIRRMLSIFGTDFSEIALDLVPSKPDLGFNKNFTTNDTSVALKYVETLAQFRADVRRICKEKDSQESIRQLLFLSDHLRDETLPNLGVRLEDKEVEGAPYVLKFVDPETLAQEKAAIEKKDRERALKIETQRLEKLKLQQEREEKAKIPANEMFRQQTDKYSRFDEKGMPTHDSTGKELSKSALKKLQRIYQEQEGRHSRFLVEKLSSEQ